MTSSSRTGRLLHHLVRVSTRRPSLTVLFSLALAAAGLIYTFHALTFQTSTLRLLPPGQRYATLYTEYLQDFGELNDIVVVVEASRVEEAKAYAARLVRELRESSVDFPRVAYRVDPARFEGQGLLYLSVDELAEIRDRVFDHQDFMEAYAARPTLDRLLDGVNQQIAAAFVSHFFDLGLGDGRPVDLRFLRELLTQISARLARPGPYRSPWSTIFSFGESEEAEDSGYFLADDGSLLFILVEQMPDEGDFMDNQEAIETIRASIADLRRDFPDVEAGVTGMPALSNDEMTTAFGDSEVATLLAFALTLGLLLLLFWRIGKPLLMLAALAASLAWSMGIITLTLGHLTIFSVMFISLMVGIGIDYGIYFLSRYEEELSLGRPLREALELTASRTGPGILIGALTAAGTFYVLMLTEFRGIQEFGYVSGLAILMAFVSMLTFFPALLVLVDRRRPARQRGRGARPHDLDRIRAPALGRLTRYPKTVLVSAGCVTVFSLWAVGGVGFDYNMLNLQAKGTESVIWEKKILATGRSGHTGLATARTLEELREKQEAFDRLPSVSEVDSVLLLIPDNQAEKIDIIQDFAPIVSPVRIGRLTGLNLERLQRSLKTLKRRLDLAVAEAGPDGPGEEIESIRSEIASLIEQLRDADPKLARPALNLFHAQLYRDFVKKFYDFQRNLTPRPVTLDDVPNELGRKFVGRSGRFLIRIHPEVDIWDRDGAQRFVSDLRSVDPDVTGSPVITYEAIRLMETAYFQGTIFAFIVVSVLAALLLRRLRETLLALTPLLLGTLWTVGLMRVFGLQFTLANVWGLPLIIGTAAEYGLNIVVRYREGWTYGGPLLARSTVNAVALNGLTTIAGFGSLMVAHHQGIFGLGLLLTIGASASLAASLIVLPVLLRVFGRLARERPKIVSVPAA
ncbi:MAG: MMPL family transporter [Candidatus Methylomirabilia bacterium]